jgi:hypothetical protein
MQNIPVLSFFPSGNNFLIYMAANSSKLSAVFTFLYVGSDMW